MATETRSTKLGTCCVKKFPRAMRAFAAVFCASFVVLAPLRAFAEKIYSIGSLNTADQFITAFEGFRERMAETGYYDGKNVRYQYYNSRGNADLLRTIARKLVQEKVDMIVTSSTTGTVVAAKATEGTQIPVLFLSANAEIKMCLRAERCWSRASSHPAPTWRALAPRHWS